MEEMRKILLQKDQASKIAESIDANTEEVFRDFDLSTFMDHFKLNPLEKTTLALAFKRSTRQDLKTKGNVARDVMVPGVAGDGLLTI